MNRPYIGFILSLLIHAVILYLSLIGFQHSEKKDLRKSNSINVSMLQISDRTNIKENIQEEQFKQKQNKIVEKKVEPDIYKTVATETPVKKQEESTEKKSINESKIQEDVLKKTHKEEVEINPQENKKIKTEHKKDQNKVDQLKSPIVKKIDKKSAEKKKSIVKKEDVKSQISSQSRSVLKSMEAKKRSNKSLQEQKKQNDTSLGKIIESALEDDSENLDYNKNLPLSISEMDAIISQIQDCWNTASFNGGADNKDLYIKVQATLDQDGTVITVTAKIEDRFANNPVYYALRDSAISAIRSASPLKGLPKNKYEIWKEIEVHFNTSGMID